MGLTQQITAVESVEFEVAFMTGHKQIWLVVTLKTSPRRMSQGSTQFGTCQGQ